MNGSCWYMGVGTAKRLEPYLRQLAEVSLNSDRRDSAAYTWRGLAKVRNHLSIGYQPHAGHFRDKD